MNVTHIASLVVVALIGSREALAQDGSLPPPSNAQTESHSAAPPAPSAKVTVETPLPSYVPVAASPSADAPTPAPKPAEELKDQRLLTGFRLGYLHVLEYAKPLEGLGGESLKEKANMRSPHQFLLGYEAFYRMMGHSWLNVLLVGNVMVGGLEQSRFFPSANALLGFEINNSFQLGVGVNVTPLKGSEAHTIIAAGWTPRVGGFYVPVHGFFVPDVDGAHRLGITTGVTF